MKQSSSSVKKISLELGGNAPFIVFDDADLDKAVEAAIICKFRNAGQTCVCANRIYIQDNIFDPFCKKFVAMVKQLKIGNGLDPDTKIGPLIDHFAIEKVEELVQDACSKGAQIICGGKISTISELCYEPTVLTHIHNTSRLLKEEIFGPVAALLPFHSETEAIQLANDTQYGLASYFFSENIHRIWRVGEGLEYGMVGINSGTLASVAAPFGGVKESGFGREGSKYGIEEYLNIKYLYMK